MIPDLVLPQGDELAKVVQIYIDENPLLICRPDLPLHRVFHMNILEEILRDRGVTGYRTVDFGTKDTPKIGPAPVGDRYRVAGMGLCQNVLRCYYFFGIAWITNHLE